MKTITKLAIVMMFALSAAACSPTVSNGYSSYSGQGTYYTEPGLES